MEKDIGHGDSSLPKTGTTDGRTPGSKEGRQNREGQTDSGTVTHYTTVAIDIYGRVYDISKEHPSWEQVKEARRKAGGKKVNESQLRCIVVNAFTCTREECQRLKEQYQKKKRKK